MSEPLNAGNYQHDPLPFEHDDDSARTLVRLLRSHYHRGAAWDRLPPTLPLERQRGWGKGSAIPFSIPAAPSLRAQRRLRPARSRRLFYAGLLLAIVIISTGVVLAASGILNLGKPTSATSTNPYFPLSGFHRTGLVLRSHDRVELLWIGTEAEYINWPMDASSAAERWPIVKTLQQFGTFSHLAILPRVCYPNSAIQHDVCHIPSFDWSRAGYRSRYVQFVHKDILDVNAHPFQKLTAGELALYNRYVRDPAQPKATKPPYNALQALLNSTMGSTHTLPLIDVGGYVQTVSQIVSHGDFEQLLSPPTPQATPGVQTASGVPFDTIQRALAAASDPPGSHVVEDVNAEVNIITALICHADGGRPEVVCGRPVIRHLLAHVK